MNWFYSCDPCAINGTCPHGCGLTFWGVIISSVVIFFLVLFIGYLIDYFKNKIKSGNENL